MSDRSDGLIPYIEYDPDAERNDPQKIIDVAILIAAELGDEFDAVPYNKAEWIRTRGGEPFRDVNMPFQCDYLSAAKAVIGLLSEQRA